jgi:hypothetical protein
VRIFISHTKEDKRRLPPFLDWLLEDKELAELDVKFWLDRPREVPDGDIYHADHPRIVGVEIGEVWREEIRDTLRHSRCVLGFWSKYAVDANKKATLHEELSIARFLDSLVPVTLDPLDEAPFKFSDIQSLIYPFTRERGLAMLLQKLRRSCLPVTWSSQLKRNPALVYCYQISISGWCLQKLLGSLSYPHAGRSSRS